MTPTLGISDIPYGEPSVLESVIDGRVLILAKRVQREPTKHARFWYLPEQPQGEHTVTFTVKELPGLAPSVRSATPGFGVQHLRRTCWLSTK